MVEMIWIAVFKRLINSNLLLYTKVMPSLREYL